MATKKQLNKKIQQLELKLHEKKYIHIPMPSWKGFSKLCLILFTAFLSIVNFILILRIWNDYNLGYVFVDESELINYAPRFADLIVLYPLLGEFILISLTIILFVSLFKELKSYDEEGLIGGLIFGLIGGLIGGLIFGLIGGLIGGLIIGLIFGLIIGLIGGLIGEFN